MEQSLNLLGDYIFRRIQKDHTDNRITRFRARESLSGLYISSKDIQRYIWDPEEVILLNNIVEGSEINPYITFSILVAFLFSLLLCLRDSQ